ncbi:hypothetical protein DRN45_06140 [Thermococci archaeon]|nr:MAG: hypothetical protein DRN45_06140 [Thermococci archaeon]
MDESNFRYVEPPSIKDKAEAHRIFSEFIEYAKKHTQN